jgi:hypothetical protein
VNGDCGGRLEKVTLGNELPARSQVAAVGFAGRPSGVRAVGRFWPRPADAVIEGCRWQCVQLVFREISSGRLLSGTEFRTSAVITTDSNQFGAEIRDWMAPFPSIGEGNE